MRNRHTDGLQSFYPDLVLISSSVLKRIIGTDLSDFRINC